MLLLIFKVRSTFTTQGTRRASFYTIVVQLFACATLIIIHVRYGSIAFVIFMLHTWLRLGESKVLQRTGRIHCWLRPKIWKRFQSYLPAKDIWLFKYIYCCHIIFRLNSTSGFYSSSWHIQVQLLAERGVFVVGLLLQPLLSRDKNLCGKCRNYKF